MDEAHDLIVVVGMPSGGTSLVAGLLHHLGVDMGRIAEGAQPGPRPYEGFECLDCWEGAIEGAFDPAAAEAFMSSVVGYVDARRAAASGPIGVKHNPRNEVPTQVDNRARCRGSCHDVARRPRDDGPVCLVLRHRRPARVDRQGAQQRP